MNKVGVKLMKNEAVVNRPPEKKKSKGVIKLFLVQLAVSTALGGALFAFKQFDTRVTAAVCESVKSAVDFDAVEYTATFIEERVGDGE